MADPTSTPSTTPAPAPAPAPAPGWKTSEFWLKFGAIILTTLFASGAIPTSGPISQVAAIAATMLGALGYTVVRGSVKAAALRGQRGSAAMPVMLLIAIAGAAMLALVGCATASKDAKTAGAAFGTCEKADLGQVVDTTSGSTAMASVAKIVMAAAENWEAELDALVLKIGGDTVACALDALEAVLAPAPSAAPGAKVGAAPPSEAVLRIRSYRAKLLTRAAAK